MPLVDLELRLAELESQKATVTLLHVPRRQPEHGLDELLQGFRTRRLAAHKPFIASRASVRNLDVRG
jgi:hypothetical protein